MSGTPSAFSMISSGLKSHISKKTSAIWYVFCLMPGRCQIGHRGQENHDQKGYQTTEGRRFGKNQGRIWLFRKKDHGRDQRRRKEKRVPQQPQILISGEKPRPINRNSVGLHRGTQLLILPRLGQKAQKGGLSGVELNSQEDLKIDRRQWNLHLEPKMESKLHYWALKRCKKGLHFGVCDTQAEWGSYQFDYHLKAQ